MAGLIVAGLVVMLLARLSVKRVGANERGVVFRLGKVRERTLRPGLTLLVPFADQLQRVDVSDTCVAVPFQGRTKDGQRARVEAALTFRVADPVAAIVEVRNHGVAICHLALVVLRTEAEQRTFDELSTAREELRLALLREVRPAAAGWGVELDRVEVKSVTHAKPSAPEPTLP
ncbi:SPFH domain-containing protein [Kitasatospora sp. NPDC051984]|uniref:SPFH domain-containing protein n=1 Tax=Kitasatospora sp. NPDC051984 TaxID=3364059 RepID=UPI0037C743F6